ncbi:MAG: AI-2E family transporter [Methylococcaceae bacterium]
MPNNFESHARLIGGFLLLMLGLWILHSFLALLTWAVILAITTWPLYQKLLIFNQAKTNPAWFALGLTLLIAIIILAPLAYGMIRLVHEAQSIGQLLSQAQHSGIPAPEWLSTIPIIGDWAKQSWTDTLGSAQAANDSLHWLGTSTAITYTKAFASQIVHRVLGLFITLLVLFFVYRHGTSLSQKVLAGSQRFFGEVGVRYTTHAAAAIRATVNGLVLVSLAEGLLLGIGYALAGLSQPAILGAITGIFAIIPFAAKLILAACSAVLIAQGHHWVGFALLISGIAIVLIADNYVRPALIGGAVQLPFIWTLLGIFGGLENFGLIGLFLGPTLMAVLMSIWRDWTEELPKEPVHPEI